MNKKVKMPTKRISFHVMREKFELETIMPELPKDSVVKIISNGGFSSIAFIRYLSDLCGIDRMYASSLVVGKKHAAALDVMHQQGKLKYATFVVGSMMKEANNKSDYFGFLENMCKNNNWDLHVRKNHSKIILFETKLGHFVLETSSNLNENPSIEQFSFEENKELHSFYKDNFFGLFQGGEKVE